MEADYICTQLMTSLHSSLEQIPVTSADAQGLSTNANNVFHGSLLTQQADRLRLGWSTISTDLPSPCFPTKDKYKTFRSHNLCWHTATNVELHRRPDSCFQRNSQLHSRTQSLTPKQTRWQLPRPHYMSIYFTFQHSVVTRTDCFTPTTTVVTLTLSSVQISISKTASTVRTAHLQNRLRVAQQNHHCLPCYCFLFFIFFAVRFLFKRYLFQKI